MVQAQSVRGSGFAPGSPRAAKMVRFLPVSRSSWIARAADLKQIIRLVILRQNEHALPSSFPSVALSALGVRSGRAARQRHGCGSGAVAYSKRRQQANQGAGGATGISALPQGTADDKV